MSSRRPGSLRGMEQPSETPTLYVCHGDDGSPIPFLRRGSRDDLRAATGDDKLPALKLPDGTVITQSKAILTWVERQP